jgi:hypothetical protein
MLDDAMLAGHNLRKHFVEVLGLDAGEEAQAAEIDAEHRDLLIAHLPSGSENRAIAAKDDGEVRASGSEGRRDVVNRGDDLEMPFDHGAKFVGPLDELRSTAVDEQESAWAR